MNQYTRCDALAHAKWQQTAFGLPEYTYQAWHSQYNSAKRRGIAFNFTLFAWHSWWQRELAKIGPHAKRGLRKGEYMMCRIADQGAYEDGNVYAGTAKQNQQDIENDIDRSIQRRLRMKAWHATHDCWLDGRRGDAHPKSRAVNTPKGRFGSLALAGEAFGITRQAVLAKVRKKVAGWSYANSRYKRATRRLANVGSSIAKRG
jgi:hypothetical protein